MNETIINISNDFNIPKKLSNDANKAWEVLIEFLNENDNELLNESKNEKLFSREFKDLKDDKYFKNSLFFIHHNDYDNRLKKWFSYNHKDENFKKLYNFLKERKYYVDKFNKNVSGIFIGF